MSLVIRGTTKAMAEAKRANARNSTGPTSARGKEASRQNALKHWGRAEVLRPMMPALGEDPEEFETFLKGLRQSLARLAIGRPATSSKFHASRPLWSLMTKRGCR